MNYGRYQIIKEVGRGSMGVVYQARDPNIDRLVAVKVLRQDRTENETFVRRFLKEAKVIGRLSHPHIVTIYDVGEEGGTVYIAMEYLEGVSLADVIRDRRPDTKSVLKFGLQMAETLEYAHGKGVVHRDIKPSNIIVLADGGLKITDFGVARIEDSTATVQTMAGEIMGTPAYMSPEQVLGQAVDGRSDLFSLGVILYELCTGKRPFGGEGKNLATVFNEIINVSPQEPISAKALIPRELSQLIMKLLEKDPDKRIQSGGQLAKALRDCLREEKYAAAQKKSGEASGSRYVPVIAVALAALVIAGSVFFFFRHRESITGKHPVSTGGVLSQLKRVLFPIPAGTGREKPQQVNNQAGPVNNRPVPVVAPVQPAAKKPEPVPTRPPGGGNVPARPATPPLPANNQAVRPPVQPYHPTVQLSAQTGKPVAVVKPAVQAHKPVAAAKPPVPPKPAVKPPVQSYKPVVIAKPAVKPNVQPPKPAPPAVKTPTAPATMVTQSTKPGPAVTPGEPARPSDDFKPMPKFALLKVHSTPKGASVYINGTMKGTTPLIVKLDLGNYKVRLSREGYRDYEGEIKLKKMTDYSIREKLKRIR